MSRGEYVYLILDPGGGVAIVAAFTVKRELLAWCARYQTQTLRNRLQVWRFRDHVAGGTLMGSVQELLDAPR